LAASDYSAREVVELLAKILVEGRGGGVVNPLDSQFGLGGDALEPGKKSSRARLSGRPGSRSSRNKISVPKQTRTVSKYQKAFGRNLKALKAKHPRTEIGTLMKRAHKITRRQMK